MKSAKLVWIMVAAMGLFSGCNSAIDRRISAQQDTWQRLSEQDQQRLRQGLVRFGDTEAMVRIALGSPDAVLPIQNQDKPNLTVWVYYFERTVTMEAMERKNTDPETRVRVFFRDGVVANPASAAIENNPRWREFMGKRTALIMTGFLHARVPLSPEQWKSALVIIEKANDQLLSLRPDERAMSEGLIRDKIEADIRGILTPEQQALYDRTPKKKRNWVERVRWTPSI